MARLPDGGDPGRVGALLADPDADQRASVGQFEPLTAALVDAHVGPDVGTGLEEPVHPDLGHPVLLVGDGEEPEVATWSPARTDQPLIATARAATSPFMSTVPRPHR